MKNIVQSSKSTACQYQCIYKRTSYALADFVPMIDLDEIYVQDT